jgi:hypothetical protein
VQNVPRDVVEVLLSRPVIFIQMDDFRSIVDAIETPQMTHQIGEQRR